LSGLEDLTEQGFEEMATVQEAIVQEVEAELRPSEFETTDSADFTD
jgi:hypothetical protein